MVEDARYELPPPTAPPPRRIRLRLSPTYATYVLIGLNVVTFLLSQIGEWAYVWGALAPVLIIVHKQWWRLLTTGFLHGDIMHIVFNLYALRGLGALTERFFGLRRFLAIYFTAMLAASILVVMLSSLYTVTVGASGAIMGLLGALLFYYWTYRDMLVGGQRYLNELLKMALINIGIGFVPGISFLGHFGGFVGGIVMGWLLCPHYAYSGFPPTLEREALDWPHILKAALVPLACVLLLIVGVAWLR